MSALFAADEIHAVQTHRASVSDRETTQFVSVEPSSDVAIDHASAPILLEHFRFGTWIGEQLTAVRHLPHGWDGYGAPKIEWPVVRRMSRALANVQPATAYRKGAIVPGADGSLQIEWHLEQISLEFCIEHDLTETLWMKDRHTGDVTELEGQEAVEAFEAAMGALRF